MSDLRKQLDADIPNEAVSSREAWKGGPQLSYLSGAYVINRLNQVLGQGNWQYSIKNLTRVFEGTISQYNGDAFTVSYLAEVTLTANIKALNSELNYTNTVVFTDVGYGDGTDKKSAGKAHELAAKEAVTDALKRCAKNLGMSMGLALYFKEGAFTGETVSAAGNNDSAGSNAPVKAAEQKTSSSSGSEKPTPTKVQRSKIKAAFRVLQEQKKITKEEFIAKYLAGGKADDLTDEQVPTTISMLKADFPNLL